MNHDQIHMEKKHLKMKMSYLATNLLLEWKNAIFATFLLHTYTFKAKYLLFNNLIEYFKKLLFMYFCTSSSKTANLVDSSHQNQISESD